MRRLRGLPGCLVLGNQVGLAWMPSLKVLEPQGTPEPLGNPLPSFARRTRSKLARTMGV